MRTSWRPAAALVLLGITGGMIDSLTELVPVILAVTGAGLWCRHAVESGHWPPPDRPAPKHARSTATSTPGHAPQETR